MALQWIEQVFRSLILRDGTGANMPARPALKFVGPTVTDDPANGQTIVDSTALVAGVINWARATGFAATETMVASSTQQGVSYHAVAAGHTLDLPATPNAGQLAYVADEDGTGVGHGITISGNGNNIVGPDATSAATYVFSTATGYAAGAVLALSWIPGANFWKVM